MPVYLLSLEVRKVFSFADDSVLDLTDGHGRPAQWTLIMGDNGAGKTTLLRCLAAMEPRFSFKQMVPRIFYDIESTPWFRDSGLQRLGMEIQLSLVSGMGLCDTTEREKTVGHIGYLVDEESIASSAPSIFGDSTLPLGAGVISESLANENRDRARGLTIYGYGASRRMGHTSLGESFLSDHAASLFDDEVSLINAEEWLLQADYATARSTTKMEAQKRQHRFDRMREVLIRVLPDVEEIRITSGADERYIPAVEFLTPAGWVPLAGLGLGYRTVVAWMVDLAARMFDRYPNSADPLAEPAVVLVDEIDLHLHPKWQRLIMSHLSERFPNTQFIATAHSPLVVQAAKDANLVLLRREGDKVVIDNDPAVIDNWRLDQILTSVFDLPSARPPEIEPLLAERRAILAKPKLTAADKRKLRQLEEKIGALPTAENPADIAAMDIIRRAAAILEGK